METLQQLLKKVHVFFLSKYFITKVSQAGLYGEETTPFAVLMGLRFGRGMDNIGQLVRDFWDLTKMNEIDCTIDEIGNDDCCGLGLLSPVWPVCSILNQYYLSYLPSFSF